MTRTSRLSRRNWLESASLARESSARIEQMIAGDASYPISYIVWMLRATVWMLRATVWMLRAILW
eukprot:295033-Pyramimonas_sp.AAC.1